MREEHSVSQAMTQSPLLLLPSVSPTLQWDGISSIYHEVGLHPVLGEAQSSSFQVKAPFVTAPRAQLYWTTEEIGLVPTVPWQAVAWDQEAAHVAFSLTPVLLADTVRGVIPDMTGALLWAPWQVQTASPTSSVHAVLLGHEPDASPQVERITILPALPVHDPLHRHIVLTLQVALVARSSAEHLYAKTLADALMVHFLRRYTASRPSPHAATGGFPPYRLQRVLTYIHDSLEHELSLATLADVAQMSLTHFAHLFKHAIGLPPHQYVVRCRIEHAKQLLVATDMPLIEIGAQVGCADQSHFTALFRKHVSLTPQAYRNTARRALC